MGNFFALQTLCLNSQRVIAERMFYAEEREDFKERKNIRNFRHVVECDLFLCKQCCAHAGECCVFGSTNRHLATQRSDAINPVTDVLGHGIAVYRSTTILTQKRRVKEQQFFCALGLSFPHNFMEEEQRHSYRDATIGEIEEGPPTNLNKIRHMTVVKPINDVAKCPADDETKCKGDPSIMPRSKCEETNEGRHSGNENREKVARQINAKCDAIVHNTLEPD